MDKLKNFTENLINSEIKDFQQLSGGASAETYKLTLKNKKKYILRRTPKSSESKLAISKKLEAKIQKIVKLNNVPVPEILYDFDDKSGFGSGYVMEFISGETIPRKILRDNKFKNVNPSITFKMGEILAKIHQSDISKLGELKKMSFNESLEELYKVYSSFKESQPVFEYAFNFLAKKNLRNSNNVLVHGDYRLGNFIISERSISSVIDWELSHVGSPLEDLSWLCVRSWRFGNNKKRVAGLGSLDELINGYESNSSIKIDLKELDTWQIYGSLRWGVICMIQTFYHLNNDLNSLEKAAIGRRVSETEFDLMNMIKNNKF
tara:strand:- start:548 stop:1507 length:960 start_codon:yes stop_codon:yes gene_type:complete